MDYLNPIYTEKTQCQDCYKCVRNCPVKAIKVENGNAMVVPDLCVLCGRCVTVCPAGAKRVRNDLPRVKRLIAAKKKIFVSLAPSFAAEFWPARGEQVVAALKQLGFWGVSETAIGADIVARTVADRLSDPSAGDQVCISSACPTVVELLRRYRPEDGKLLTGLYSPLLAHASFLRRLLGRDIGVVFIGPCIAKKGESDTHRELVDAALGFRDLAAWFDEEGIVPAKLEPGPDDCLFPARARVGSLFPLDGGMTEAVRRNAPGAPFTTMTFSGIEAINRALDGLGEAHGPLFLELLACEGGCINGPSTISPAGTAVKRLRIVDYARPSAGKDGSEAYPDIRESLPVIPLAASRHSDAELTAALREVGKHGPEDELNCSGCGYDSCRAFARAMLEGKAEKTMCVSYMRQLAQKKANALIRTIPSGVIVADRELRVVECNRQFAELMGDETVAAYEAKPGLEGADLERLVTFHELFAEVLETGHDLLDRDLHVGKNIFHASIFTIEKRAFVGGVFQDVTTPSVRKDRVVAQARKVISKNLAVVQKIAFLLGENAAESEAILNSIVESFSAEDAETGDGEDGSPAGKK